MVKAGRLVGARCKGMETRGRLGGQLQASSPCRPPPLTSPLMSTASTEAGPSGRPSTSEGGPGPLQLFDTHLRFLGDSYLTFFQERCVYSDASPLSDPDPCIIQKEN